MSSSALLRAGRLVTAALLLVTGFAGAQIATRTPSVIGSPIVREGRLDVLVEDYPDGHSRTRHFLKTPQGRVELTFTGAVPHLRSGSRVRVHGQMQGGALMLDGSAGSIETLTTVLPNTMGEHSVAVLLVNFQDDTSQPMTVADAQSLVLGDVSKHYEASSFGQTWFKGQVFGWFTIAMSKTTCDPERLAMLADEQAALSGIDLTPYQHGVYMFPKNACDWEGLGNVGGTDARAWINGTMTLQVVGHELGHNYGLLHAHSLDCNTGVFGDQCFGWEYGDAADLMGNNRPGQFDAFEKEELGWLNDGVSPPITTVTASGRYAIEPYAASTVGPKALKVLRGTDSNGHKVWYYIEYRQPIGGDTALADAGNLTKGVIVRTATEGDANSSYQLDMTPGSSTYHADELADGALEVGESHVDDDAGVTLKLASANSGGASIDVQIYPPVCTRAAPSVSLSPSATGGPPGTAVGYTLSVTNHDSAACGTTTFSLAKSVPAGWTGTLGTTNLPVGPGATASTVLTVISDPTTQVGSYGIGAATASAAGALHTANATSTYVIVAPCTRSAPTVSLVGGGTAVVAGTPVGYTLSVTNRDSSTCAATTFTLAGSVPAGWTGKLGTTSMTLSPGATASTPLNVTSDAASTAGSYGIGAATASSVGAAHTANASATYNVAGTCTRAAPVVSLTGGGAAVVAGTPVGYTLSVTNRDSSFCPTTTFAVARSVPSGWTGTLGTAVVTVAPGATARTTLTVTSPASAAGGGYGIGAATASPVGTAHTANASATYVVASRLSIADTSVVEGNSGTTTANFIVSLAQAAVLPVTFNVTTRNGTAVAGSDYTAVTRAVTIPAGSASVNVSVPVIGDAVSEADETFQVLVSNVVGATVTRGTATETIRNDDTSLSIADVSVVEGNVGTRATFTVKLSNVSAKPVTFNLATANGTAVAGSDYTALALSGQSIPAGATSKTFTVAIAGDTAVEANETFLVNVTGVSGAAVADGQAVGTIRNDDTVLSIADASITEGNSGTKALSFTVKLSAASANPVSFSLATANKTAVAASDYVALSLAGQSIPAGSTSKTFNVTVNGDTVREANETFVVNVSSVSGATVGDAQALGTIVNDD